MSAVSRSVEWNSVTFKPPDLALVGMGIGGKRAIGLAGRADTHELRLPSMLREGLIENMLGAWQIRGDNDGAVSWKLKSSVGFFLY